MSNAETTIPAEQAMNVASQFMSELHGTVTRAKVAGSLRRGKSEVHDIEIIVAPVLRVAQSTLIPGEYVGTENKLHNLMLSLLDAHKINRDRPRKDVKSNPFGPRYYRINYGEYPIDLFVVLPPAQWGVIYLIRTGPADFSHWFVQQGIRYGIRVKDGHLVRDGKTISTPEEVDVFREMHVPYRGPQNR